MVPLRWIRDDTELEKWNLSVRELTKISSGQILIRDYYMVTPVPFRKHCESLF